MSFLSNKATLACIAAAIVAAVVFGFYSYKLHVAHSTFENYYAFRGCTSLITRTDIEGTCALASGKIITIVKFRGAWYLDGDLPTCPVGFCF